MRKRPFGASLPPVSQLSLGTWGLSGDGYGRVAEKVVDEVIERARAYGITLFETADAYGAGAMEKKLGQKLADDAEAIVVTRVGIDRDAKPPRKRFDRQHLRDACARSAERLRRSPLDVVLLHNPTTETARESEAAGALKELVADGQLRAWGVSAGSAEVAQLGMAHGAQVIELAYNVLYGADLEALAPRPEEVGVLARSVLAYGLLCGQWPETRIFPDGDHRAERWTQEQLRSRLRQLSAVSGVLGGDVLTLRAAALRFVLASDHVSSAVMGPRNRVQLDQLVREAGPVPEYLATGLVQRVKNELTRMGVSR
jgi:aryl-alcohol dehydrogenase-like predicted oxidoreductase